MSSESSDAETEILVDGVEQPSGDQDIQEKEEVEAVDPKPSKTSDLVEPDLTDVSDLDGRLDACIDWDLPRMTADLDAMYTAMKARIQQEVAAVREGMRAAARQAVVADREARCQREAALQAEVAKLRAELDAQTAMVQRKDEVIDRLVDEIRRQKDRVTMAQAFCSWRSVEEAKAREKFCLKIAGQRHQSALLRRAVWTWKSALETTWKERIQRGCRAKAEEVCVKLAAEHDEKTGKLMAELAEARAQLQESEARQQQEKENLRAALMRGVCALNLETFGVLQDRPDNCQGSASVDAVTGGTETAVSTLTAADLETAEDLQAHACDRSVRTAVARQRVTTGPVLRKSSHPTSHEHQAAPAWHQGVRGRHRLIAGQEDLGDSGQPLWSSSGHSPITSILVERHHPVNKRTAASLLMASHERDRRSSSQPHLHS